MCQVTANWKPITISFDCWLMWMTITGVYINLKSNLLFCRWEDWFGCWECSDVTVTCSNKSLLEPVVVRIDIQFLEKSIEQNLPARLAVFLGGLLKAVAGVVATYPQHIPHGVPELWGPVEVKRLVLQRQWWSTEMKMCSYDWKEERLPLVSAHT